MVAESLRAGKTYTVAVAGVTFRNPDGRKRQSIIRRCQVGEELILLREPDNPYDSNAVAVRLITGEQIGYLPREHAEWVAEILDRGQLVRATIWALLGGGLIFKRTRGVQIAITKFHEVKEKKPKVASAKRKSTKKRSATNPIEHYVTAKQGALTYRVIAHRKLTDEECRMAILAALRAGTLKEPVPGGTATLVVED